MSETQSQIAERLARHAHAGQFRRDGVTPCITHPEAVAGLVESDEAKAVAWLHDTLEDTALTPGNLHNAGICAQVISAVMRLTKLDGVPYEAYIASVAGDPLACEVKLADIRHNLSESPTDKQREKYAAALRILAPAVIETPPAKSCYRITTKRGFTGNVWAECLTLAMLQVLAVGEDVAGWELVDTQLVADAQNQTNTITE